MSDQADIIASLFQGFVDPIRVRLLLALGDGEVTVGELARRVGQPQPKVSTHLARLRAAGLVETRREHRLVHYRTADDRVGDLLATARSLLDDQGRFRDDDHVLGPTPTIDAAGVAEGAPAVPPDAAARPGLHVCFDLGGERYALPVGHVREIVAYREPRRVPSDLPSLVGMLPLRDGLVAVHDLGAHLGLAAGEAPASIVIAADRWGRVAGLTVALVDEIIDVEPAELRPPGSRAPGVGGLAIGRDAIAVILDADALVGHLGGR
jgi:chemotaxis signal transduction protein/DNA-binding transcriptional ArsR family regulator